MVLCCGFCPVAAERVSAESRVSLERAFLARAKVMCADFIFLFTSGAS